MAESAKGVLFKNDRKQAGSKQPDWSGNFDVTPALLQALLQEANATGVYKARVAAWVRQGPRGTFLSLSLEAPFKGGGQAGGGQPQRVSKPADPFDDAIPF